MEKSKKELILEIELLRGELQEKQKLEAKTKALAKKYQSIFEAFQDLYYRTNKDGIIELLSPSVKQLTGYEVDEMIGESVVKTYANKADRKKLLAELDIKGEINNYELILIKKNGEEAVVSINARKIYDDDGELEGVEGVMRETVHKKLSNILDFNALVTKLAFEYINLPIHELDKAINNSLMEIGRFTNADRSYIFNYNWDKKTASNTYEWCNEGISAEIENLQDSPFDFTPDWIESHKQGNPIIIADTCVLPEDSPLLQIMEVQEIKSLITIPLIKENVCFGFVGFDFVRQKQNPGSDELEVLNVFAKMLVNITERKQKESERLKLTQAMEQSANSIILTGLDGNIEYVNPKFTKITGYTKEEVLGQNPRILQSGNQSKDFYRQLWDTITAGQEWSGTFENKKKDGTIFWENATIAPVFDESGKMINYIAVKEDITEQKLAESALQKSETLLRLITDNTSDNIGITTLSLNPKYTYVNPSVKQLLGYDPKEFIGKPFFNFVHPDDKKTLLPLVKEYVKDKMGNLLHKKELPLSRIIEFRMKNKSGDYRLLQSTVNIVDNQLIAVSRDITEQKQAEEALIESARRLSSLMTSLPGMAYRCLNDANWTMEFISEGCLELTGYKSFDLIQNKEIAYASLIHQEDEDYVWTEVQAALKEKRPYEIEYRIITADGSLKHVWEKGSGIYNGDKLLFLEGLITDINASKQARTELIGQKQRLDNIIQATNVGTWEWHIETGKMEFNERWAEIIGYTLEEIGQVSFDTWKDYVHPDDGERSNRLLKEHLSGRTDYYHCEARMRHKNGDWIWVLDVGKVVSRDEDGKPLMMSGTHQDITDLKNYEMELSLINDLNQEMNAGMSLNHILQKSVETLVDYMHFHTCDIYTYDSDENNLVIAAQNIWNSAIISKIEKIIGFKIINRKIPLYEGSGFTEVVRRKQTISLNDPVKAVKDFSDKKNLQVFAKSIVGLIGFKNAVRIPLMIADEIIGILGVTSLREFSNGSIETLERIGVQLAIIIQKASQDETLRTSERNLDRAAKDLRQLLETANAPIFGIDGKGRIDEWNKAATAITGYGKKEALGTDLVKSYIPDEFKKAVNKVIQNGLKGQGTTNFEFLVYAKSKQLVSLLLNVSVRRNAEGEIVGILGVGQDITELKEKEDQILAIANYTYDWETWFSPDGKLLWVNPAVTKLTGYSVKECHTMPDFPNDMLLKENRKEFKDLLQQALIEQSTINDYSFRIAHKDGSLMWMAISWQPIYNQKNEYAGLRTSIRNITDRMKADEALRTSEKQLQSIAAELEDEKVNLVRRVEERTAELRVSNAELAKAARLKDEFLASMSHELRTPLNSILGLSEALQEEVFGTLNQKQLKSLHTIEQSGKHLLSLINEILDLAKIEAGKIDLEYGKISIDNLVRSSLVIVKQTVLQKQLKISSRIQSSTGYFTADEKRMKQILVNLLSNAVKFTPEQGEISLFVEVREEDNMIDFCVTDTGIGISEEDINSLFESFVQIDSSLSRQYEGTGLGLALVRRLAELHGGTVSVESEVNKGSRFTVSIPLNYEETQSDEQETDNFKLSYNGKKALIIEDNQVEADQLARYLKEIGLSCKIYQEGNGAIEKIKEYAPDLVFLDIGLPGKSGWEILKSIKTDQDISAIPVVLVSVLDEEKKGFNLRADEYIVKPLSRDQLCRSLRIVQPLLNAQNTPDNAPAIEAQGLILLAEDNETNIVTIKDYLEAKHFRVIVARNGKEALEKTHINRPDLILMDIQMPVMDGLEATRSLRTSMDHKISGIPVIALTAMAMKGDEERCMEAGANEYITKPVRLKDLVQAISTLLDKQRMI